ncbi:MAG: hypothetical protein JSV19_10205 [Phycisphaerales bacterium]|nr:MAG: hypothetical protein JSV19_10205 [Phycisphaerales bacterium]
MVCVPGGEFGGDLAKEAVQVSTLDHPDSNDPLLAKYLPSERRAILVHRYFLGIERQCDPGLPAAIESWEAGVAVVWRQKKMHGDRVAQMSEIDRHRSFLSSVRGREVGWDEAVSDWVRKHAEDWRRSWEESPAAGA